MTPVSSASPSSLGVSSAASIERTAIVEDGAVIGPGCYVHGGAYVGAAAVLESDVDVAPNAVLDAPPGSPSVRVGSGVRIGANATICTGVSLAAMARVRPGAVVTRDVPPRAIVEGNPAAIIGYVGTESPAPEFAAPTVASSRIEPTSVRDVTVHRFPVIPDLRGSLTVGEFQRQIPFAPLRYFMVFGVPSREIRGEHAHLACHQFLLCVHGSCAVVADDGDHRVEVVLDSPDKGIHLPPMTWGIQYKYSSDAVLLVFASHHYDAADYVRDYDRFLALVRDRAGEAHR